MKNKKKFFYLSIAIMLLTALFLGACNNGDENDAPGGETPNQPGGNTGDPTTGEGKGEILIGRNNWAENIAVSAMWKILLEEKGYEVELKTMDKAPVWLGISDGELDLALEVWLPYTDKPYMDKYGEKLEMHDIWYENTGLGLVVPTYMDINSIEDLKGKKDELGIDEIVGIDPGASLTQMAKNAIEEYDLDYELLTSSGPAMMSELTRSYNKQDPIVVTLWNPHWAFSEFDLKYLEDPKKVFGEADDIYYMTRTGFKDDYPEVVKWLNNWKMDDDSLGSLMAIIKDSSAEEGAQTWIDENRELVDQWIK